MSGAIKINGTSSGSTTITAPASGADETIELSTALAAKLDVSAYTPGLGIITPTSIAYSGGSATSSGGTITLTGVSSISLNGVFSASYENYRVLGLLTSSAGANTNFRLRASGTDDTSANYHRQYLEGNASTVSAGRTTAATSGTIANTDTNPSGFDVIAYGPFLSQHTVMWSNAARASNNGIINVNLNRHNVSSAFDGFTLIPATGSITGTIRVYGYEGA